MTEQPTLTDVDNRIKLLQEHLKKATIIEMKKSYILMLFGCLIILILLLVYIALK